MPFAFVLHPALLLIGTPTQIVLTSIIAVGAAIVMGCELVGYCLKPLNMAESAMLMFDIILIILPARLLIIPLEITPEALSKQGGG